MDKDTRSHWPKRLPSTRIEKEEAPNLDTTMYRPERLGVDPSLRPVQSFRELIDLVCSPKYRSRFAQVRYAASKHELSAIKKKVEKRLFRPLILAQLGINPSDYQSFENSLKKSVQDRCHHVSTVSYQGSGFSLKSEADRMALRQLLIANNPKLHNLFSQAENAFEEARNTALEQLRSFYYELGQFTDLERLISALDVWGQARNSQKETNSGYGYNAGVIHYFEYRASANKNRRFKSDSFKEFSLNNFMELSETFAKLLTGQPSNRTLVSRFDIADSEGRARVFIKTDKELLVGFKHINQRLKLLSFIPNKPGWEGERRDEALVERELNPSEEETRFNRLGANRRLVYSITRLD